MDAPISSLPKFCPVRSFYQPVLQVIHNEFLTKKLSKPTLIFLQLSIWLLLLLSQPGKWVVTPDYVLDSVKNGSWLAEEPYEIAVSTHATSAFYPVRPWREKVASGRIAGAFQGWRVLLMVQERTRRATFKRWGTLQNCLVITCDKK